MATASITATLNGGDAVTADNDLIFKIYGSADGYTTPIKTTGSHTSDADVTVTGDSVTINNVNVGAETLFKITALDAAANESVKSDAYDATPAGSEFPNFTFDGVVIDSSEWTIVNPDNTLVSFTQNDKLIVTKLSSTDGIASKTNRVETVRKFSSGTFEFDYTPDVNIPSTACGVGLINSPSIDKFGGILNPSTGGNNDLIRAYTTDGGNNQTAVAFGGTVKFKLVYDGSTIDFYYDKGAGYVSIGEYTAVLGDVAFCMYGKNGTISTENTLDNVTITDYVEA